MKRAILAQTWGGLGDNLQFTTLPGLYHQRGIEFYLSSKNVYRNEEIYDIVWSRNPYVKGIVDEPGNIGHPTYTVDRKGYTLKTHNIITAWETEHFGTDIPHRFKPPVVFYTPKIKSELYNKTIVDLGGVSYTAYDIERVKKFITNNFDMENVYGLIKEGKPELHNCFGIDFPKKKYEYKTYEQYMNIISSCENFVCLYSGSNSLAAALNHSNLFNVYSVFQWIGPPHPPWHTHDDPGYLFNNVTYKNILVDSELKL